ncbi:hypothetical protein BS50DRAFT_676968 [Corynespora cassiicola Philippines]|uniref:Brl1/Brr6 domain-containing protein n=1 Tax=Corynespora cassiicola Philippines TaxID=1448308 RepID=A0A2T2NPP6_CORCC|nr:hypothetical protein BS50DRAFT_676968 [Corynespora cassiicola Philippines]
MARGRGSTTPMDFEWENQAGPIDERSPFLSHTAKKRPHSVLDSPSKNSFSTPNRPHLRDPNNQSYFFSHDRPLPSVPSYLQSSKTWEPRTPASNYDFSSGGETPTTPGLHDDSEASVTPDTQMAKRMGRLMNGDSKSPKKGRRESWFKAIFSASPRSPSPSKDDARKFSRKAEHRVMKRRSKKSKIARPDDAASGDEKAPNDTAQQDTPPPPAGFLGSVTGFFTWIEAHPHLPSVLSYYFNLFVNSCLGLGFLFLIYTVYAVIWNEVDIESQKHIGEIMSEIAECAKNFRENRCDPDTRVPAMFMVCENWEKCMQRDPRKVAYGSVSAKTFAKIFNTFIEELSYKSLIFTAVVIFGGFNLSNWAFGFMREKNTYNPSQHHDFVPATPQRYPSNSFIEHQQQWNRPYQTPYALQHTQSMPVLPSTTEEAEHERRSPTKRLIFR